MSEFILKESGETYCNPVEVPESWQDHGIGDPFVMKYNGQYYLYCSTGQNGSGFRYWTSWDCAAWHYGGLCCTDPLTVDGYAPEVVYWNGTFYLYTSPGGRGHYVFTSPSPEGPFVRATDNLGCTIDGSVLIDDDGQWYFYYAGEEGICGAPMPSPLEIGEGRVLEGTQVSGGWTEGPTVFRRNGNYYMTTTGNHVLSHGYRVNLSVSGTGPLDGFREDGSSPVLLKTMGMHTGLGHNSIFVGPDLDTMYMVYHCLTGVADQGWPLRKLSLDAVAWDGDRMCVCGPTSWPVSVPARPDFEDRCLSDWATGDYRTAGFGEWECGEGRLLQTLTGGGTRLRWTCAVRCSGDMTAEFHVRPVSGQGHSRRAGCVFGLTGEDNYGYAVLDTLTLQLCTGYVVDGCATGEVQTMLPPGFDMTALHCLRVTLQGSQWSFSVDGMCRERRVLPVCQGYVGYLCEGGTSEFGYLAVNCHASGRGIRQLAKPVPGVLLNHHALEAETPDTWRISIEKTGAYLVDIETDGLSDDFSLSFICDEKPVPLEEISYPYASAHDRYRKRQTILLESGIRTLKVLVCGQPVTLRKLWLRHAPDTPPVWHSGSHSVDSWTFSSGQWTSCSGRMGLEGSGMRLVGEEGWSGYEVSCRVRGDSVFNCGILFHACNPSLGGAGDDPEAGADFVQGYFAGITPHGIVLGKLNYGWKVLAFKDQPCGAGASFHLKVRAEGNRFRIFLGDDIVPQIDYTDRELPWVSGMAGLRGFRGISRFEEFCIQPLNETLDT